MHVALHLGVLGYTSKLRTCARWHYSVLAEDSHVALCSRLFTYFNYNALTLHLFPNSGVPSLNHPTISHVVFHAWANATDNQGWLINMKHAVLSQTHLVHRLRSGSLGQVIAVVPSHPMPASAEPESLRGTFFSCAAVTNEAPHVADLDTSGAF
jgi:hypothetical protein